MLLLFVSVNSEMATTAAFCPAFVSFPRGKSIWESFGGHASEESECMGNKIMLESNAETPQMVSVINFQMATNGQLPRNTHPMIPP